MIRVMIVDDHERLREFLIRSLVGEPDIEVVAVCGNGEDAIDAVAQTTPDVILMDMSMPGLNGAEASAHILQNHPEVRIWLHTAAPHHPCVPHALNAGARGVVAKNGDLDTLLAAIRSP